MRVQHLSKILLIGVLSIFHSNSLLSQSQNALNFDGVDDYVGLTHFPITNEMTVEFWIKNAFQPYSGNDAPIISWGSTTNNAHIIIGQVNGLMRFTYGSPGGGGSLYQGPNISDGNWHHYAITLDFNSSTLTHHLDGVQFQGSSFSFPSPTTDFLSLGALNLNGNLTAFFDGTIDNLRIWNTIRTPAEIQSTMNLALTGSETNLIANYNFNQGIPNGNNPTVTTLIDTSPSNNTGTLNNFTLNGNTSNWIEGYCYATSSTDVISTCGSYTWIDGNTYTASNNTATQTLTNVYGCDSIITLNLTINNATTGTDIVAACGSYTWIDGNTYTAPNNTATYTLANAAGCDSTVTLDLTINTSFEDTETVSACSEYVWTQTGATLTSSGTYYDSLTTVAGCDSVFVLDLTINSVSDLTTSLSGITISANNANATYQWLDCDDNYAPISGEVNQSYTPSSNGNYAVEITENGCADTSACVSITTVGLDDLGNNFNVAVYPNPSEDYFLIKSNLLQSANTIKVISSEGRLVFESFVESTTKLELNAIEWTSGVYFLILETRNENIPLKLIKE